MSATMLGGDSPARCLCPSIMAEPDDFCDLETINLQITAALLSYVNDLALGYNRSWIQDLRERPAIRPYAAAHVVPSHVGQNTSWRFQIILVLKTQRRSKAKRTFYNAPCSAWVNTSTYLRRNRHPNLPIPNGLHVRKHGIPSS